MSQDARQNYGTYFALGLEGASTYGTAVSRTVGFDPQGECMIGNELELNPAQDYYHGGSSSMVANRHFPGRQTVRAKLQTYLRYGGIGVLLQLAMGAVATQADTPTSGRHTHTYTMDGDMESATGEMWIGTARGTLTNLSQTVEGAMIDALTIAGEAHRPVVISADFLCEVDGTPGAASVKPTAASGVCVESSHSAAGGFTWGSAYAFQGFSLSIKNNLGFRDKYGSSYTAKPYPTNLRTVQIEVEREYTDDTFRVAKLAGTANNLVFTFTRPGATADTVTVTLENAIVLSEQRGISGFGVMVERLTFVGQADASSTETGLKIVIVNAQATAIVA